MVPLNSVKAQETVRVVSIRGGLRLKERLSSIGIYPGVELKVVINNFTGPVVVSVGHRSVGVGKGMAGKIFVEPVDSVTL